jgi:hypothetical protein
MSSADEQISIANLGDKMNATASAERLRYNFLGRTGLKVSDLCLGAVRILKLLDVDCGDGSLE